MARQVGVPGSSGQILMVVTSRNQRTGLIAVDDAPRSLWICSPTTQHGSC